MSHIYYIHYRYEIKRYQSKSFAKVIGQIKISAHHVHKPTCKWLLHEKP